MKFEMVDMFTVLYLWTNFKLIFNLMHIMKESQGVINFNYKKSIYINMELLYFDISNILTYIFILYATLVFK